MKRKVTMDADELEIGMSVHPPEWTNAPDRVDKIVDLKFIDGMNPTPAGDRIQITTEFSDPWTVRGDEKVQVIYL